MHRLLAVLPSVATDPYSLSLYRAMFLLAFHAFLWIGEITVRPVNSGSRVVQLSDCTVHDSPSKAGIEIILTHFKGNVTRASFSILISPTAGMHCPVRSISRYICGRAAPFPSVRG